MNDIKNILENYTEQPSEQAWERLSARMDRELPTRRKTPAWKWVASLLIVAMIGGGIGVFQYLHKHQKPVAQNSPEAIAAGQNAAEETDTPAFSAPAEETATVSEPATATCPEKTAPTYDNDSHTSTAREPAKAPAEAPQPSDRSTPKSNIRQIVLPPNSTLAKQLAADPVLKTLSDESVDWSLPAHLSIPNIFTPNNDGVNDFFVIEGLENYTAQHLVIRDKNNRVVYQSDSYRNNWGGENCPDGVYSYEFSFAYNGIENQASGKVRILRS